VLVEPLLEIGVLGMLAWPSLRAASSPTYRRVFPYDAVRLGVASAVYLGVVAAVAIYQPRWLRIPAMLATAVVAYSLWRARPGYGVSSGLPPGSLSPLPVRPWSDPDFYKRQSAHYGHMFKLSQFSQPMVCLVGLDRANRLLLDHDEQLVAPPLPFSRFIEGGYLRYLPEETHVRYRRFFRSLFYSEAVANAEPRLAAVFRKALTAMAEESKSGNSALVKPACMRMMYAAWAELFYAIDEQHQDFARLKELAHVIDIRKARWATRRRVEAALREIEAILRRRVATFTAVETAAPSCFLAVLARNDPTALADRTILGNLIYIMQVTWGDVTGLLVWIFKMLSDHPDWRQRLEQAIATSDAAGRDLATRIVQETLRLEQSEHRYRRATADLELDGCRIPKGWLIRMCVRESHQDEKTFPHPERFDPDRFIDRAFTRGEYAPFGAFRLACIGEKLTKTTGALFASELVSQFEWQVEDDGPPEINSWAHNAPNPRFSVRIAPRSAPR
jgi:cytochrome P450